jgi:uncharacterized protein (TIGR02588 family)
MIHPPRKNWLEWTVFTAGLLLLLATTGYLGYQALVYGHRPAALKVTLGEPWTPDPDDPSRVVVPVTVRNEGGHTAADVTVEISLVRGGDEPIERRELTFAFVPHMSSRAGALTFEHRPDRNELRAQVLGYLEP